MAGLYPGGGFCFPCLHGLVFDCFGELGEWDFVFPVLAGDPNLYVRM